MTILSVSNWFCDGESVTIGWDQHSRFRKVLRLMELGCIKDTKKAFDDFKSKQSNVEVCSNVI